MADRTLFRKVVTGVVGVPILLVMLAVFGNWSSPLTWVIAGILALLWIVPLIMFLGMMTGAEWMRRM